MRWPLDEEWDEQKLEQALFPPGQTPSQPPRRTQPDFAKSANNWSNIAS